MELTLFSCNILKCVGYIDLSKRRVDPEDVAKCEERYNKAKAVHSVMRHMADQRKVRLEDVYKQIGWPLYAKYKHAYDAFKMSLSPDNEDPGELPAQKKPRWLYASV